MSPEEERTFDMGAELHRLSDKIDNIYKNNIVIPKKVLWRKDGESYDYQEMRNEFEYQVKYLKENPMLTERQKRLFQEDKHTLIDMIISLEEDVQFLKNEMLLEKETRLKAEKAHVKAQEEIDMQKLDKNDKPLRLTPIQKVSLENMLKTIMSGTDEIHEAEKKEAKKAGSSGIDKAVSAEIQMVKEVKKAQEKANKEKEAKEEGENGSL